MNIPNDALRAYNAHRSGAAFRGIPFTLTLDDWWELWKPRWHARTMLDLQMCRTADLGGYCKGNVRIDTRAANVLERRPESYQRSTTDLRLLPGETLPDRLNRHEVRALRRALVANHGNASAAARMLGISFRQMRYALKKHARLATMHDAASLSDLNR